MTNYTPIDHLADEKKKKESKISYGGVEKGEYSPTPDKEHIVIHEVGEHEPSKEVKPFVDSKKDKVKLQKELKEAGVVDTGSTSFQVFNPVKLPISDSQLFADLHQPVTSSARWFGEVFKLVLRQAHQTVKKIHGKIVRVIS